MRESWTRRGTRHPLFQRFVVHRYFIHVERIRRRCAKNERGKTCGHCGRRHRCHHFLHPDRRHFEEDPPFPRPKKRQQFHERFQVDSTAQRCRGTGSPEDLAHLQCLQSNDAPDHLLRQHQRRFLEAIHDFRRIKNKIRVFGESTQTSMQQMNRLMTEMHTSMQRLVSAQEEMRAQIEVLQKAMRNHFVNAHAQTIVGNSHPVPIHSHSTTQQRYLPL
uniref:Calmodulin-binding domain-containing protein n=1 Tax=Panagrolaimus sp. JU765 TaxID=591449 RepID=A0AC34PVH3_9BILA